jgi:signal peptidase I
VAVALVIQLTSIQAFYIPSKSMDPTLEVGDRLLVNKWSYRLHDVNRGDIVVFERPEGETSDIKDLVKRVIGLPGETVTISDNHVLINGQVLDEPYLPEGTQTAAVGTYPCPPSNPCQIPEGHVWVMGDNRPDSKDSRYFNSIPESKIVGRAFFRVWPLGRIGPL